MPKTMMLLRSSSEVVEVTMSTRVSVYYCCSMCNDCRHFIYDNYLHGNHK